MLLGGLDSVQDPVDVVAGAGVNAGFVWQAASAVDCKTIAVAVVSFQNR